MEFNSSAGNEINQITSNNSIDAEEEDDMDDLPFIEKSTKRDVKKEIVDTKELEEEQELVFDDIVQEEIVQEDTDNSSDNEDSEIKIIEEDEEVEMEEKSISIIDIIGTIDETDSMEKDLDELSEKRDSVTLGVY